MRTRSSEFQKNRRVVGGGSRRRRRRRRVTPPGAPIYIYIYISVVNGLASLGHGLMGLTPSGDHGGRDLASLARGLMALTPSGNRIHWVGRNGRKGLKKPCLAVFAAYVGSKTAIFAPYLG